MSSILAIVGPRNQVLRLVGLHDANRQQTRPLHQSDGWREVLAPVDGVICEPANPTSEQDAYAAAFNIGLEGADCWDARWSEEYRRAAMSGLLRGWLVRSERIGREFGLSGRSSDAAQQAIRPAQSPFPIEVARTCEVAWRQADKDRRAQDEAMLAWVAEREDLQDEMERNRGALPGWDYAELVEAGGDLARSVYC